MMKNKPFSITGRIKSFKHAFHGLKLFFVIEHNGRIHAAAAVLAIVLSYYFQISRLEWLGIIGAIALVIIVEMLNTAIEKLADVVSPSIHPQIKVVKDVAASAVLIAAIFAVVVAMLVFLPKLF